MRRLCVMIVCCLLLALLPGCAGVKEYTRTFFAMDTVITIRLTAQDDQQAIDALDAVQELVSQLEGMWSRTLPDSEVSRLNAGERLSLDDRTARLLVRAADLSEQTNGAFSPMIATLVQLWDVQNAVAPPPPEEMEALLPLPDAALLRDAGQAQFALPEGGALDLGGIAKGAAGDSVMALLRQRGVERALVVMGGQVGCLGNRSDETPWQIALRNPDGEQEGSLGTLLLADTFAVSSGDYGRYFEYDGVRDCHILDPATGRPPETDLRGVTVVSSDGTAADALSTALYVMGSQKALALWREQGGFEAVFITKDRRLLVTKGLERSFTFTGQEGGYVFEIVD